MKRFIYFLTWLSSFIFIAGIFFKIMKLPYTYYLLLGGESVLGMIALPAIFYMRWKEGRLSNRRILFQWISGQLAFIIFIFSTWIRFESNLIGDFALAFSYLLVSFTFLPALFYNMYRQSMKEI